MMAESAEEAAESISAGMRQAGAPELHVDALAGDFSVDAAQQTPQHAAWADFVELVETLAQQVLHRVLPANRLENLLDEQPADFLGIVVRSGIDVRDDGDLRQHEGQAKEVTDAGGAARIVLTAFVFQVSSHVDGLWQQAADGAIQFGQASMVVGDCLIIHLFPVELSDSRVFE